MVGVQQVGGENSGNRAEADPLSGVCRRAGEIEPFDPRAAMRQPAAQHHAPRHRAKSLSNTIRNLDQLVVCADAAVIRDDRIALEIIHGKNTTLSYNYFSYSFPTMDLHALPARVVRKELRDRAHPVRGHKGA